jgi:hypothetical protein
MFCSDAVARLMRPLEQLVERLPQVRALGSRGVIMVVETHGRG